VYFVVAASSSFRFKGKEVDVRDVARELGARYVIEGSLRKAATNIRINVQLADAVTGTQLWAENFDRDLRSQEIFALQDQLTDQIVATVADQHGVLARSMGALVTSKPAEALDAYESVLQWFAYLQGVVPEEHLRARTALELAVLKEPYFYHAHLAAAAAQLGRHEEARAAADELLKIVPNFAEEARGEYEKWNWPRELLESLLDGLRKAGLAVPKG
jgi:tetratricopeptide (TPR) repeat protein